MNVIKSTFVNNTQNGSENFGSNGVILSQKFDKCFIIQFGSSVRRRSWLIMAQTLIKSQQGETTVNLHQTRARFDSLDETH